MDALKYGLAAFLCSASLACGGGRPAERVEPRSAPSLPEQPAPSSSADSPRLPVIDMMALGHVRWDPPPDDALKANPSVPGIAVPAALTADLAALSSSEAKKPEGLCRPLEGLPSLLATAMCFSMKKQPIAIDRGDRLRVGCRLPQAIEYVLRDGRMVRNASALLSAARPLDANKAVALVYLLVPEAVDPTSPRYPGSAEHHQWRPVAGAPSAIEAHAEGGDWIVYVPVSPVCGCNHPLLRRAFRIAEGGDVTAVSERAEVIAYAPRGPCVD